MADKGHLFSGIIYRGYAFLLSRTDILPMLATLRVPSILPTKFFKGGLRKINQTTLYTSYVCYAFGICEAKVNLRCDKISLWQFLVASFFGRNFNNEILTKVITSSTAWATVKFPE